MKIILHRTPCSVNIILLWLQHCWQTIHSWKVPLSKWEQTSHIARRCVILLIYTVSSSTLVERICWYTADHMQKTFFWCNYEKQLLTPGKWTAKADPNKTSTLKKSGLNKLRSATLSHPSLCAKVFKIEITGLSECFTKSNKSQFNT